MATQPPPLSELLLGVSNLLGRKKLRDQEEANWWNGTADGGPANDGMYPRTDGDGTVRMVPSIDLIRQQAIEKAGTIGLFSDIKNRSILPATNRLVTTGKSADGFGAGTYVRYLGATPAESPIMTQSSDGAWWVLDPTIAPTASMFGVPYQDTTAFPPDTTAIFNQALGGSIQSTNTTLRRTFNLGQNYNIRNARGGITLGLNPVYLRKDQSFHGEGWSTKVLTNPNGSAPTIFALNTDGNGNWIDAFPGVTGANFGDFYFDARPTANVGKYPIGFEIGISAHIKNVHMLGLSRGVRQINQYVDQIWIDRLSFVQEEDNTGSYFIDLGNAGDGCLVSSSHASIRFFEQGNYFTAPRSRNTRFRYKVGSRIVDSLNGDHEVIGCDGIAMDGFHMEYGQCIVTGSSATLKNHNFWSHTDQFAPNFRVPAISIRNLENIGNICPGIVHIADCGIILQQGFHGGYNYAGQPDLELPIPWTGHLVLERFYRKVRPTEVTPAMSMKYGIITEDPLFNSYSHFASNRSEHIGGRWKIAANVMAEAQPLGGLSSSGSAVTSIIGKWKVASGRYYYKAHYMLDVPRMIGTETPNETFLDLVNGQGSAQLIMEKAANVMLRIYRGMQSGVYDKYIDLPIIAGFRPNDMGTDIGGFPWQDRTPGPADTLNVGFITAYKLEEGSSYAQQEAPQAYGRATVHCRSNMQMPSTGIWHAGDMYLRDNPDNFPQRRLGYRRISNGGGHVLGVDWLDIWESSGPVVTTTANLLTAGVPINQKPFKRKGVWVFNETTDMALFAKGGEPTDPWVDALGAIRITPQGN